MIKVKNLTKKYGNNLAIDHLNFTLQSGQIYGLLGPNGAGKSTTMNIMTGYLAATEGTVTINGFDILDDPEEARKCIGFLPEYPPLYVDMTIYEYLKFAACLKGIPRRQVNEAVSEAMEMAKIQHMKNRLIRNLSKGYQQRTGLAQAVLGFPDIIILDEPTVGLDPLQIIEIRETIRSLKKNHTVILSSHILSEVSAVCDHILILSNGHLVASDTTENLTKNAAGKDTLNLTVQGNVDQVEKILREYCRFAELTATPSKEKDCVDIYIEFLPDQDEKLFVLAVLHQARLPIHKMTTGSNSLEDIFKELTTTTTVSQGGK